MKGRIVIYYVFEVLHEDGEVFSMKLIDMKVKSLTGGTNKGSHSQYDAERFINTLPKTNGQRYVIVEYKPER